MKSCFGIFYTVHDIDCGGSSVEAGAWYPDAFRDFSSGLGDDDIPPSTAQDDRCDRCL